MLLPLLGALQVAASPPQPKPTVYNGRAGQTAVRIPALPDSGVVVDGNLDEPIWQQAALLTGFSEYSPVDQRPAPDSTDVLVWHSRDAIYFGIRAYEPHGAVRATLADRDNISTDDNVEIFLDTYHERNRAFLFLVNPLGIQGDGIQNELAGYTPGAIMAGGNDLTADFRWSSRGHVTPWGYEVEIRIPFSSLRYPLASQQDWGLQIQRNVQHSGYQETWTPARKASASFLVQEGTLVGMTDMHHGQVVELNPELTNTITGAPCCAPDDSWHYDSKPRLGGNVRWAAGSNFVVNGTVKPDFSQVEADATQIAADERFALYYPEKRPFFIEGADKFNVPNTLLYTRTIVQPDAAVKLTGKLGRADLAMLSALDDPSTTATDQSPLINILRLRRGFGDQSMLGAMYSARVGGGRANRVGDADLHYVFGGKYFAEAQGAFSSTTQNGVTTTAPLWNADVDGTGRRYGFHYALMGIGDNFADDNGFVQRTGVVNTTIMDRLTLYGAPGARVERFNVFLSTNGTWNYDDFFAARSVLESHLSARNDLTLRGGWSLDFTPALSSYAFDPSDYADYQVETSSGIVPFRPSPRITTFTTQWNASTPQYQHVSASAGFTVGNDVDFLETSRVRRLDYNASVDLRPTPQLRVSATYQSSNFTRRRDGEHSQTTDIPRLKVEYQFTRSIFFRVVAQYSATKRALLVDPASGDTLIVGGAPPMGSELNQLRADWLFSYRPTPGTVFFLGYGSTGVEPDPLRFRALRRTNDAFFVKASYVFRALGNNDHTE